MKRIFIALCIFGLIQPSHNADSQVPKGKKDSVKIKQARSYLDILQIEKENELDTIFHVLDKLKRTNENIKTIKIYLKDTTTFQAARAIAPDTVKK